MKLLAKLAKAIPRDAIIIAINDKIENTIIDVCNVRNICICCMENVDKYPTDPVRLNIMKAIETKVVENTAKNFPVIRSRLFADVTKSASNVCLSFSPTVRSIDAFIPPVATMIDNNGGKINDSKYPDTSSSVATSEAKT